MEHASKALGNSPRNILNQKTFRSIVDGSKITRSIEIVTCKCEHCGQEFDGKKVTFVGGKTEPKVFLDKLCQACILAKKAKEEEESRMIQIETKRRDRISMLHRLGVSDLNNTFDKMRHPQGFKSVFDAFKDLADGKSDYYMLLVYGGTGNGKTKCCEATVITLYDKGIRCQRHRWSDIVRHLKELMKTGGYEEYFSKLRDDLYLIIDDVGSGSTGGSWEWGELEDIVDYRSEKGLFTIITSNLNIIQKDREPTPVPWRIVSRFRDKKRAKLVFNETSDQRPLEA